MGPMTTTGAGGAGRVFRDNSGRWVKGFSAKINVTSPLEAELSLVIVNDMHVQQLEISTDSMEVINTLDHPTDKTNNLVYSCRAFLLSLGSLGCSMKRESPTKLQIN